MASGMLLFDPKKSSCDRVDQMSATSSAEQQQQGWDGHAPARVRCKAPFWKGSAVMPARAASAKPKTADISLADYLGRYLVLFFYPNDFTTVCPTELIEFSDRIKEFEAVNCNVVACSCDSTYCHEAWMEVPRSEGGLDKITYPILSDVTKKISRDYGVLHEEDGVSLRGLFIVDTGGVVRHITVNDYEVGRSVSEVLRLVKALQYTDVHGEGCPSSWEPGDATVSDDKEQAMHFFTSHYSAPHKMVNSCCETDPAS